VAANVQQMLIVIAPKPVITPILLDSYLVAAEALNIKPIIIYNKTDIGIDTSFIEYYESIDYTVIQTSTINQLGFNTLIEKINDKISVFVGQSGVGKSTLISTILPNEEIKNQSISTHSELGKHTTSNSTLYHLPSGGSIIDSPGIREFGLWHMDKNKIVHGFKEFRPLIGQCKYKNCTHTHEPECALINTVNKGLLSKERLKSLQYLIQKF
jgi:ribosome biogenesis GTPase